MRLHHVAVVRSSEAASEQFFAGLLGLRRIREKRASAELCRAVFGVDREHRMLDFAGSGTLVEVFLAEAAERPAGGLAHVCLAVDDVDALAARAEDAGVEVRRASRGGSAVTFLVDDDGNLYELKPAEPTG